MPRRLEITRTPGADSRILPGVPAPTSMSAGACALARAIMAALAHTDRPVSYDVFMGLSGIAFALGVRPDFDSPPTEIAERARVPDALSAVGLRGDWRAPPITISAIKPGIDAGYPTVVLGWPQEEGGWAIIAGFDAAEGVICGWPADRAGPSYIGAPPRGAAALIITGQVDPPTRQDAAAQALAWAVAHHTEVAADYDRWREALFGDWEADPAEPELLGPSLRHELLCERLADARAAAASFLHGCAELLGGVTGDWLIEASEAHHLLVERLEGRRPPVFSDGAAEALASAQWRADWAQQLLDLADLDARASTCIRRGLNADIGPTHPRP